MLRLARACCPNPACSVSRCLGRGSTTEAHSWPCNRPAGPLKNPAPAAPSSCTAPRLVDAVQGPGGPRLLRQLAPAGGGRPPRRPLLLCQQQAAAGRARRGRQAVAGQPLWLRRPGDGQGGVPLYRLDGGAKGLAQRRHVVARQAACAGWQRVGGAHGVGGRVGAGESKGRHGRPAGSRRLRCMQRTQCLMEN